MTVVAPATGDYTLASSDSRLPLTLQNGLDVPVRVRLRLVGPPGFAAGDTGVVEIRPGTGAACGCPRRCSAPARSWSAPDSPRRAGAAWAGRRRCASAAPRTAGLALGITGLAFAVLVGAVLVRLLRRLRSRPAAAPAAAGSPADRSRP